MIDPAPHEREEESLPVDGGELDDGLDWAGLEAQVAQQGFVESTPARSLIGYFRDCAIATQRGLNLRDVYDDREAQVLSVGANAWSESIGDGVTVEGREAVSLAVANQVNPLEKPLVMGALFIVGRRAAGPGRPRQFCAPLLVASVSQTSDGTATTFTLEGDVGLNLSLLASVTDIDHDNEEEMLQRFEGLMDLIPDAPLETEDVARFYGALSASLDLPFEVGRFKGFEVVDLADEIAQGGELRLVPTSALFIGKDAAELSVIRELDAIGQLDFEGTALQALLDPESLVEAASEDLVGVVADGPTPEPPRPVDWHDDIEVIELTDTQRKVVSRARTERLTVVTGPPGTGKSYSISALVLDHLLAGRTVLVTSGTPKAVEVVVSRLEEIGGPFTVATSGDRAHQRELAKRIDELTSPKSAPAWYPDSQLQAGRTRYYALRSELRDLEERLAEVLAQQGALAFHLSAAEGLAHLSEQFDLATVRRTPTELDQLRERTLIEPDAGWFKRWRAHRALESLRRELRATPGVAEDSLPDAIKLVDHRNELAEVSAALDSNPDLLAGWNMLAEARQALLDQGTIVLGMQRQTELARLLDDQASRLALKKFGQALRVAQHKPKKELLAQVPIEVLLQAFPCWASTDRFLSHILPLRRALFDLVVIDEASQVDLAAASPSLFRGQRAVIVGDPNQLRFVCFLSTAAETAAFSRHEVPAAYQATHRFSRNSLFDTAERAVAQRNSLMLDEHFRSQPHIISFSNTEFYGHALRIMTERPHSSGAKAIDIEYVNGRRESGQARNDAEVEAAVQVARKYVDQASDGGEVKTLGLLSPYRDQANALTKAVSERFSPGEIARHKITYGTAHSLQGDERDVVILSTVIDGNFNPTSLRFLEDPNVFNVAITRAAERLVCVTSVRPEQLPSGPTRYLKKFLLHAENVADPEALLDAFGSNFEREVATALRDRGYRVISQYPSCGYFIDLVVVDGPRSIAIECDGHPSHFRADGTYTTDDIQRHVVLRRARWDIYRVQLSTWRINAEGHIEGIINLLEHPDDRTRGKTVLPQPLRVGCAASSARTRQTTTRRKKKPVASKRPGTAEKSQKVSVTGTKCICGGMWVLRTGRYGRFYGCSRYPRCRHTERYA